jgi:hypothetical protein
LKFRITDHDGTEHEVEQTQSDGVDFELHFDIPFVKATMETVETGDGERVPVLRIGHMFFLAYAASRRVARADGATEFPSFDEWRDTVAAVSLLGGEEVEVGEKPSGPLDSDHAA